MKIDDRKLEVEEMFRSPNIERFCETFEQEYLVRVAPPDEQAVSRWVADDISYIREGFWIKRYLSDNDSLLVDALQEWNKRESIMLEGLKTSEDIFDRWFRLTLRAFYREQGNIDYRGTRFALACLGSREIVRNIGWVRIFACFLPRAVPNRQEPLAKIGRRMAAIFYLERIDKWIERNEAGLTNDFAECERIDAYWKYATELCS